ncbi:hypothetical protein KQX54_020027 [Cotesia glomerata]|uniref:Uncharacterized protein n=1 Tax=Cotesia glomerata TaxID=32391 RepID=A0AAV7HXL3_COTGL|nr:hypothetical protein KQX54_020027 [Cotesia glomerata]
MVDRMPKGTDEDDSASVASQQLDGKAREWLVRAAQGDYQALAKLAAEEPRLTRQRDCPFRQVDDRGLAADSVVA